MDASLVEQFKRIVGTDYVITDSDEMSPYGIDRTTLWAPNPLLVVRPASNDQVQKIVQLANEYNIPLVPSGGRTGYSGGAVAKNKEVVVSLERMNRILHFSGPDQSVTCEAGVITRRLQEFAEENGLFYAVDLASSGSCQIGGNAATNAGGIHVIRYGGTREQVLGLKVVTGNGDILDLNRGLIKNNCGADLRHLFIGSEGILGFICEVTLKLQPPRPPQSVVLVSAQKITDLLAVYQKARNCLVLSAFEFISRMALEAVEKHTGQKNPFAKSAACYGLLEFDTPQTEAAITDFYEYCIGKGWIEDAVISQSMQQAKDLWRLRENISESLAPHKPLKHDIAIRLETLPAFIEKMEEKFSRNYPELQTIWFGHLGDGNIHLNVLKPDAWSEQQFADKAPPVTEMILSLVNTLNGSISAEHGIGLLKRDSLLLGLSAVERQLGSEIKRVFDGKGIMNPGKVV